MHGGHKPPCFVNNVKIIFRVAKNSEKFTYTNNGF